MEKQRLDRRLQLLYPHKSRHWIQEQINAGRVLVNGSVQRRPGRAVFADDTVYLSEPKIDFVSRAGHKLYHALHTFGLQVTGMRVVDLGISTGGFTDCLLQAGAAHVWGVDVASKQQVHASIRVDRRVTVIEKSNVQQWRWKGDPVDLVTADLSFISLTKAIPAILSALENEGMVILLIKPQFELPPCYRNRKGVCSLDAGRQAVKAIIVQFEQHGFQLLAQMPAVICGGAGNQEYVVWMRRAC